MLVGCLAIAGIPPFSGFFSKDEIIAGAFERGDLGVVLGVVGIAGAGLTAFYMFRLYFRPSGPGARGGWDVAHPHPGRLGDERPVVLLAIGATFIGWLQVPGGWQLVVDWLEAGADGRAGHRGERLGRGDRLDRGVALAGAPSHSRGGSSSPIPTPRLAGVAPATRDGPGRPVPLRRGLRAGGGAGRAATWATS